MSLSPSLASLSPTLRSVKSFSFEHQDHFSNISEADHHHRSSGWRGADPDHLHPPALLLLQVQLTQRSDYKDLLSRIFTIPTLNKLSPGSSWINLSPNQTKIGLIYFPPDKNGNFVWLKTRREKSSWAQYFLPVGPVRVYRNLLAVIGWLFPERWNYCFISAESSVLHSQSSCQ